VEKEEKPSSLEGDDGQFRPGKQAKIIPGKLPIQCKKEKKPG